MAREATVTTPTLLDRAHHAVLEAFVARGRAPDHRELAGALGVAPEEAPGLLRALVATGMAAWLQPGTDLVASYAPFNELPTPYRVSVDGQAGWFAQCGFEALAMTWVFPGRRLEIDAPCPHCGAPMRVAIRDGVLQRVEPEGLVCHVDLPFREWSRSWPDT